MNAAISTIIILSQLTIMTIIIASSRMHSWRSNQRSSCHYSLPNLCQKKNKGERSDSPIPPIRPPLLTS